MAVIRRIHLFKVALVVLCSALAMPVMAGLIYVWEDDFDPGVTGFVEFADGIGLGDTVDPYTPGNIADFGFVVGGGDLGLEDLYFVTDLVPDALGLCSPNCDAHIGSKTAVKKTTSENILFSVPLKKKATKKKTKAPGDPADDLEEYFWNYSGRVYPGLTEADEVGTAKTAIKSVAISGSGQWILDSPVPVPAPSTLLLFLAGVTALSLVGRRIRGL